MFSYLLAELPSKDDYISKITTNPVSFLTQLLALVVLIIAVIIFAYKPVKKIINARKDFIDNNIKNSELNNAKANANLKASEEAILASKKKAQEILLAAEKDALKIKENVITETKLEISAMKNEAQRDIEQSKLEAQEEIRKEMVSLALSASSEILKREVNEKDNARLAENFIKELKR